MYAGISPEARLLIEAVAQVRPLCVSRRCAQDVCRECLTCLVVDANHTSRSFVGFLPHKVRDANHPYVLSPKARRVGLAGEHSTPGSINRKCGLIMLYPKSRLTQIRSYGGRILCSFDMFPVPSPFLDGKNAAKYVRSASGYCPVVFLPFRSHRSLTWNGSEYCLVPGP
jgi:hypothetical protein